MLSNIFILHFYYILIHWKTALKGIVYSVNLLSMMGLRHNVKSKTYKCKNICLTSLTRAKPKEKWNFPLNFRTMRKLSDLYSRIFQTQSSGCASGVDLFRNFTKLKILNI